MKYYILLLAFLVAIFILPELALAVPETPPPALPGSPEQTPIDGGLGLLAAAGGAYALNKLRQKKRAE